MHDLDRTYMEYDMEGESFQPEVFEFQSSEMNESGSGSPIFNETQEYELAAELADIRSEAELDRFLGDFIKKAGQAAGRFVASPTGQALGGILKGAAAQALPVIGGAIGGQFGGPRGQQFGSQVASALGQAVGLQETELSGEDRDLEVARGLVRFGAEAVRNAAMTGPGGDPRDAAKMAAIRAAKSIAPGLLRSGGNGGGMPMDQGGMFPQPSGSGPSRQVHSGRWVRRGNKIVLHGV